MIEINFDNVSYEDRVRKANCVIEPGLNTVIGPSGSGKSTMALLTLGLINPTAGIVKHYKDNQIVQEFSSVDKKNSFFRTDTPQNKKLKKYIADNIGFISQNPYLLSDVNLSARETIIKLKQAQGYNVNEDKVVELADSLSISANSLDRSYKKLSGGEKQRISIIFALSQDPNLIIADEPTASVDPENKKRVFDLFKTYAEIGRTVLLITHDEHVLNYRCKIIEAKNGIIG